MLSKIKKTLKNVKNVAKIKNVKTVFYIYDKNTFINVKEEKIGSTSCLIYIYTSLFIEETID